METCINYCSPECAYISSDERHWINRVRKLKEQYPEQVRVITEPENNDGCIYATVPIKWVRVNPPRKMNFSDEHRAASAERLRAYHRANTQ